MKGPIFQLFLLSLCVAISLWVGIKWFLGSTNEASTQFEARSAVYSKDRQQPEPGTDAQLQSAETSPPTTLSTSEPTLGDRTLEQPDGQQALTESEPTFGDRTLEQPDEQQALTEGGILSDDERAEREKLRQQRLAELGLIVPKTPEPTVAVDVALNLPQSCAGSNVAKVPAGLKFRFESSVIRGESLNTLEELVALYRQCGTGEFTLAENPLGRADADQTLKQMRIDEVKYFFIQHSISLESVVFPEE